MQSTDVEEWRSIPGYSPVYQASNLGRVRSLTHEKRTKGGVFQTQRGRVLTASVNRGGYPFVSVKDESGTRRTRTVHSLVTAAFIGPRPDGLQVRHLDGNPANPVLTNLAYGTAAENARDMIEHGTHHYANATHCKRGHAFTTENTLVSKFGRGCRQCRLDRAQAKSATEGKIAPAKRTECPQGHPYTLGNTYVDKRGHRSCKECGLARNRERYNAGLRR